jgi:hypothetical protein
MMNDDLTFWKVILTCFVLAMATSISNCLRQPIVPPLRQMCAMWFYAGANAVAVCLGLIHFAQVKSNFPLYFSSIIVGLADVTVLAVISSKMLPAIVNYLGSKFGFPQLIGESQVPPPPPVPPAEPDKK